MVSLGATKVAVSLGGIMAKKLYVGNLPYSVSEDILNDEFSKFGKVVSSKVVTDRDSGRSKGFGFVEMENDGEADKAIESLHGQPLGGRNLVVAEAKPPEPREGGRGGGGGGFRGGGGRGGGGGGFRGGGNRGGGGNRDGGDGGGNY